MPRTERSVCAGCGKLIDGSVKHRAKNILLRLFVSVRSSKHLEPHDPVCVKCHLKFKAWFKKGRNIYADLFNIDHSVDDNDIDEKKKVV